MIKSACFLVSIIKIITFLTCNISIIILKLKAVVENRESKMQSGQLKVEELNRNLTALETKSKTQSE
jgi:hypothetical protein